MMPPSGMQTMPSVTAMLRRWTGEYSASSVVAFGMVAPRPKPAMVRQTPSATTSFVNAVAPVASANSTTAPISDRRRPTRSPK